MKKLFTLAILAIYTFLSGMEKLEKLSEADRNQLIEYINQTDCLINIKSCNVKEQVQKDILSDIISEKATHITEILDRNSISYPAYMNGFWLLDLKKNLHKENK